MKKLLAILLCITMLVALTSCITIQNRDETAKSDDTENSENNEESKDSGDSTEDNSINTEDGDEIEDEISLNSELTENNITGTWSYTTDYVAMTEEISGMTVDEYFESSIGYSPSDLGIDIDDYDITLINRMVFNEDGSVTAYADTAELIDFNNDYYAAYTDSIRENPEILAQISGYSLEELEAEAEQYEYTFDEYVEFICDTIIESSETTMAMLEAESEGTYTIADNKVSIVFITEFEGYDPIESTETYEFKDGALVGIRNETMEMTFTKE